MIQLELWSSVSSGDDSDVSDLTEEFYSSDGASSVVMGQMTAYFHAPGYSLGDALG